MRGSGEIASMKSYGHKNRRGELAVRGDSDVLRERFHVQGDGNGEEEARERISQ